MSGIATAYSHGDTLSTLSRGTLEQLSAGPLQRSVRRKVEKILRTMARKSPATKPSPEPAAAEEMQECTACGIMKPKDQFHKKSDRKSGMDSRCKSCKRIAKINYYRRTSGMNETRFKSIVNGLNSTAKKVFESVPNDTYWSANRIQSEMFRKGVNQPRSAVDGSLIALIESGLVIEPQTGLFACVKVTKPAQKPQPKTEAPQPTTQSKEKKMTVEAANPFDAVREVAIKFLDVAKTINALASEIDLKLTDVEKHMAANDQDTAKLKQLQVLLKSLG